MSSFSVFFIFLCVPPRKLSELFKQADRPADGQAHNGVIITLNGIQPDRRAALDGVGTGLIVGLLCGGVPLDLLLAQWEKVTLQVSTKLSVRVPSETQTPVCT